MKRAKDEVRIVIGQRGWVWVGYYRKHGAEIIMRRARTIRVWGTNKGLGQLCQGLREGTVLDEAGTVRVHELAIIATYDADLESWKKVLDK